MSGIGGSAALEPVELPDYLTHYFSDLPFRSLTELESSEAAKVV